MKYGTCYEGRGDEANTHLHVTIAGLMNRNFLAFDLGAESGRAVLGMLDAGKLSLKEIHRFANPTGRMSGHLHWNLLAQWEELKTGLRKAASGGATIDGLGVDTWGVDFGLIGHGGEILGYPYHYRDGRTDGMLDAVFNLVPREQVFAETGVQFMQLNSLYQLFAMKRADSPILAAAETLLFMPDLFNFLFTGIRKSEFSIATTSQFYDPRKRTWAFDLLEQARPADTDSCRDRAFGNGDWSGAGGRLQGV